MYSMKKHIIYLTVLISTLTVFSQEWKFLGGPEGIFSNDILFTKNGLLISATYKGIFVSNDFGESWKLNTVDENLGAIHEITELFDGGIIGVSEFGIVISDDTCKSWNMLKYWPGLNYESAGFILQSPADSSLYFGRGESFYQSKDRGFNWEEIWNGSYIDGFTIDPSGIIYLGVNSGHLMKSIDNGKSFQELDVLSSNNEGTISKLYANNSGGLYFKSYVDYPNQIYHYENGRLKVVTSGWLNIPLGITNSGDLIYKYNNCIKVYNPTTGESTTKSCQYFVRDQRSREVITFDNYWVGNFESESLFRSDDHGQTWENIQKGHGHKPVLSFEILDDKKILAGTFGSSFWGGLFSSSNDGKDWQRIQPNSIDAYFVDISSLGNDRIIATGSDGVYLSENGGKSWFPRNGINLAYSQYVSRNRTIYVGNDLYGIYLSRDDGYTWVEANNGVSHSYFFGFGESISGKIFAFAWPNGTYSSTDNGATWDFIDSEIISNYRLYDTVFKDDVIYAGTSSGLVKSIDDGLTWSRVNNIYGSVRKMIISPTGDLVVFIAEKGFFISSDNGRSWYEVNNGFTSESVYDIQIDYLGRIIVSTESGIYSYDNYKYSPTAIEPINNAKNQPIDLILKWEPVPASKLYKLCIAKDSLFTTRILDQEIPSLTEHALHSLDYSTTYYWQIEAIIDSNVSIKSNVNSFTTTGPNSFYLRQNYPNPFNNLTTIIVDIPVASFIELYVYDILGQKVNTITKKELSVGSHKFILNGNNLSSGVYFISFIADDFMMTRKIILIK